MHSDLTEIEPGSGIYVDPYLAPGLVRIVDVGRGPEAMDLHLNEATRVVLTMTGRDVDLFCWVQTVSPGLHPIPSDLLMTPEAQELQLALEYAEQGPSEQCALGHCQQPTYSSKRGFSLCSEHAGLLDSWDDLINA